MPDPVVGTLIFKGRLLVLVVLVVAASRGSLMNQDSGFIQGARAWKGKQNGQGVLRHTKYGMEDAALYPRRSQGEQMSVGVEVLFHFDCSRGWAWKTGVKIRLCFEPDGR